MLILITLTMKIIIHFLSMLIFRPFAAPQMTFAELDWCKSGRVFYNDLRAALDSDRFSLSQTELRQLTSQMKIDERYEFLCILLHATRKASLTSRVYCIRR